MRQTILGSLLPAFIAIAPAQEPTPAERFAAMRKQLVAGVTNQLQADDLPSVAWGAHAAAEYRLAECIPELRARLTKLGRPSSAATEFAALALLDALVETGASVPGEELVPFLEGWCMDAALALLGARAEANRELLLQQYRLLHPRSEARVACGSWLTGLRDPAFLRELLHAPVTIDVLIGGSGEDFVRGIEIGFGSLSHFRPKVPSTFPSPSFRHLTVGLASASVSSAPVQLTRTKHDGGFCLPDHGFTRAIRTAHTTWLRQYLDELREPIAFDRNPILASEWQGVDALREAVDECRRRVTAQHRVVVNACLQAKLLDAAAVAAIPAITFDVQLADLRADRTTPLPTTTEWSIRSW
jgi:hypothetical protein